MLPQRGLHRGRVRSFKGNTEFEGGVGPKLQFVEEEGVVAVPADEQSLGRPAGRRPAADDRIKMYGRINVQDEHAQGLAEVRPIENGRQRRQIDPLVLLVSVEILEANLARPQDFTGSPGNDSGDRPRGAGGGHPFHTLSVQQEDTLVTISGLEFLQPRPQLCLRFGVIRAIEKAPHQPGKRGVLE